MFNRSRTRSNPVFYPDQLRLALSAEPERADAVFRDPHSIDLLTWNIFASLDTHTDPEWLAYQMQALGGSAVSAPVRFSMWSGKFNAPELRASHAYLEAIRNRSANVPGPTRVATPTGQLADFSSPIEVPVRVETPGVLLFVDTAWHVAPRGNGGRDRLVELIDAGLDHARRVGKKLAVAVIYATGSSTATDLSHRINALRDPDELGGELPWRTRVPPVALREQTWTQLAAMWEQERDYLDLGGQPVRAFLEHLSDLDFR